MHVKRIFFLILFFKIFSKNPPCKSAISCCCNVILNAIVPFLETPAHRHRNFCSQRALCIMEDAPQDTQTHGNIFFFCVCVCVCMPCATVHM